VQGVGDEGPQHEVLALAAPFRGHVHGVVVHDGAGDAVLLREFRVGKFLGGVSRAGFEIVPQAKGVADFVRHQFLYHVVQKPVHDLLGLIDK